MLIQTQQYGMVGNFLDFVTIVVVNMEINNREAALLIWIVVFVIWTVIYSQTRKAIPGLLKVALQPKLIIIYGIIAAYTAGVVYFLYRLEL